MKTSILLAAIVLAMLAPVFPAAHAAGAPASATEETRMTAGVVRKLDSEQKKITLQHEAIANLGMPPMTMAYGLGNAALADKVKVGDRVNFRAERINGAYVVTELAKADTRH